MNRKKKILSTALILLVAAAITGVGLHATFTSTLTGGPQSITTATLRLQAGVTNQFENPVSGIVAGDTIESAIDIVNNSTPAPSMGSVTFSVSASPSSLLDSTPSASGGLTLEIQSCSVEWTAALLGDGGHSYTCSGSTTTILATTDVATLEGTPSTLTLPAAFFSTGGAGNTVSLMLTVTLPSNAPNSYQTLSSTLNYGFTGTQRAAANE